MTRIVVLERAANADAAVGFLVRLGPLAFECLAAPAGEELGVTLEAVGSVLTPADPKPTPFAVQLPVRGLATEPDAGHDTGYRLRRQLRQLLSNPRWRWAGGLYFHFEADPELDGWLLVGGGKLNDEDPGILLGDWTLELSDVYVVGRPGTHRPARRLELADRRTGLTPLDTRGVLYATDYNTRPLPARPLVIPGDVAQVLLTRNRPPSSIVQGPLRDESRRLWRELAALDGDVASYLPDDSVLPDAARQHLDLDGPGSVRVWDTGASSVDITLPSSWSFDRDTTPELMAWERIYGPVTTTREARLAVDNGVCRLLWLGRDGEAGLALEYWDDARGHFRRLGRFAAAVNVREATIVELTPERAVLEWRGGPRAMRAVLQRGWYGPRLEAYDDTPGGQARLEYVPDGGTPTVAAAPTTGVDTVTTTGGPNDGQALLWARGRASDAHADLPADAFLNGTGVAYTATGGALVAQLGSPAGPADDELASLAIADARNVPVLITR